MLLAGSAAFSGLGGGGIEAVEGSDLAGGRASVVCDAAIERQLIPGLVFSVTTPAIP
jgi:hypothetical protein